MPKNPYEFTGPLDPLEHASVCMFREREINSVVNGILQGHYWTILGPRQIGKTTFLRQVKNELSVFPCIYINLEVSPKTGDAFYDWLISILLEAFGEERLPIDAKARNNQDYDVNFYEFLKNFRPGKDKKIILLFDEIERVLSIKAFLKIWRKIFHMRYDQPELKKYSVVITGAVDLIPLTMLPTSPFNIAKKIHLTDLTEEESERLIDGPFKELNIKIEQEAKQELISQTSGHPQLLQHICHILVDRYLEENRTIDTGYLQETINSLFTDNNNLETLGAQIKSDKSLGKLIKRILNGEQIPYFPHKDFSLCGVGPIVEVGEDCGIRNKIYEKFLRKVLEIDTPGEIPVGETHEYSTTIFLKEEYDEALIDEKDKEFFKHLFDSDSVNIEVSKKGDKPAKLKLNRTEKLIFCYLAYVNYRANKDGDSVSKRKYHLSSVPQKNMEERLPEWGVFVAAMNKESRLFEASKAADTTIRGSIHKIRKKLKKSRMSGLIPKQDSGRGEGYWLKGSVVFSCPVGR